MCRSKHVEQLRNIGIINSTTRSHLVGYFYTIYNISILVEMILRYTNNGNPNPWNIVLPEKLTVPQLVKKFPHILWNPEVHHRIHKSPTPVPSLNHNNIVHIPIPLLQIHFNIIVPIYDEVFQVVSSLQVFPPKLRMHLPCLPNVPHAHLSYYTRFDYPNYFFIFGTGHPVVFKV